MILFHDACRRVMAPCDGASAGRRVMAPCLTDPDPVNTMITPESDTSRPSDRLRLPAEERTIKLQTIADRTKLNVDGAEFLLMKTLSLHLIEGVIDEVDSTVQVRAAAIAGGALACPSRALLLRAYPIAADGMACNLVMTFQLCVRANWQATRLWAEGSAAVLCRSAGCSRGC